MVCMQTGIFSKPCARGARKATAKVTSCVLAPRHLMEWESGKSTSDISIGYMKPGPFYAFTYGIKTSLKTLSIPQIQER